MPTGNQIPEVDAGPNYTIPARTPFALTAIGTDEDAADVLTYSWSATGGRIVGSGANVTFDASGLAEGSCTVTAQVSDGFNPAVD